MPGHALSEPKHQLLPAHCQHWRVGAAVAVLIEPDGSELRSLPLLTSIPSWIPSDRHPIALWAAPCKMNDQENDRDDQEHVNQAARDVEHKPTQDPCDEKDHK
jgi:hypothetical protein